MNDYKTFREMLKGELLIMLLYVVSSFSISVFFWERTKADSVMWWKEIIECFVMLAICLILIGVTILFQKEYA